MHNDLGHRIPGSPVPTGRMRSNLLTCPECKHQFVAVANVLKQACPNCRTEMRVRPMEVQR